MPPVLQWYCHTSLAPWRRRVIVSYNSTGIQPTNMIILWRFMQYIASCTTVVLCHFFGSMEIYYLLPYSGIVTLLWLHGDILPPALQWYHDTSLAPWGRRVMHHCALCNWPGTPSTNMIILWGFMPPALRWYCVQGFRTTIYEYLRFFPDFISSTDTDLCGAVVY